MARVHIRERDLCAVTMTDSLKGALFNDGADVCKHTRFGIRSVGRWEFVNQEILE